MITRPVLLACVSAAFALVALGTWFVLLRPVPEQTTTGVITRKTFKPASTYWQYPVGAERGFRTANPIPVAECFVFEIQVAEWPGPAFFALNKGASEEFDVGQTVRVRYQERSLPLVWSRTYVLEMERG
jgi:hypothetical protein